MADRLFVRNMVGVGRGNKMVTEFHTVLLYRVISGRYVKRLRNNSGHSTGSAAVSLITC
jgi:hypothetical protein